jgi:hypothetical protein
MNKQTPWLNGNPAEGRHASHHLVLILVITQGYINSRGLDGIVLL